MFGRAARPAGHARDQVIGERVDILVIARRHVGVVADIDRFGRPSRRGDIAVGDGRAPHDMVGLFQTQLLEPADVDVFAIGVVFGVGAGGGGDAMPSHGDPAERDGNRHMAGIALGEVGELRPGVDDLPGQLGVELRVPEPIFAVLQLTDIFRLAGQIGLGSARGDHVFRAQANDLADHVADADDVDPLEESDLFALQILDPLFGGRIQRKAAVHATRGGVDLGDGRIEGVERPTAAIGKKIFRHVSYPWRWWR